MKNDKRSSFVFSTLMLEPHMRFSFLLKGLRAGPLWQIPWPSRLVGCEGRVITGYPVGWRAVRADPLCYPYLVQLFHNDVVLTWYHKEKAYNNFVTNK